MLSTQELADIAARHLTAMADAMIVACIRHAVETGEKFEIPERVLMPSRRGKRPKHGRHDYDRMMRSNGETRAAWRG